MSVSGIESNQNTGVALPAKPKGRASRELKSQGLQVVEQLMVLGIERPTHMAKKTGLTFHTAKRWMQEIKDHWTSTLTEEEQNFRRELLYQEAESVARDAWVTALGSNNASVVVGAFKTILEANARRGALSIPDPPKRR
jgi:hypothetical protein